MVKTLPCDEQKELRAALDASLAEPEPSTPEEKLRRLLFERGLLSEIKPRGLDPARYRDRRPIEIKCKPLSETIIEERR